MYIFVIIIIICCFEKNAVLKARQTCLQPLPVTWFRPGPDQAVELLAVKAPMEDTLHTASHKAGATGGGQSGGNYKATQLEYIIEVVSI